jgi:hypothetical protein
VSVTTHMYAHRTRLGVFVQDVHVHNPLVGILRTLSARIWWVEGVLLFYFVHNSTVNVCRVIQLLLKSV